MATQQILQFTGSVVSANPVGSPSGQSTTLVSYDEKVPIQRKLDTSYTLTTDNPVTVDLGNLTGVNFLSIRAVGDAVTVDITSSAGTSQALPVDPFLVLGSDSIDITAITLTRTAGVETEVFIVLGQKA